MPSRRTKPSKPQPRFDPISEYLAGFDEGSVVRGTTELYLPSGFGHVTCEVDFIRVEFMNLSHLKATGSFRLCGSANILNQLYKDETWKLRSLQNFVRNEGVKIDSRLRNVAPIMEFLFTPWLRLRAFELKVDGQTVPAYRDQTPDFIFLPNSFPPLVENMPNKERFGYYEAKTTAIYAPLFLGRTYSFTAEIRAFNPLYDFALLFPYNRVRVGSVTAHTGTDYGFPMALSAMSPVRSPDLPPYVEERMRERGVHRTVHPPRFRLANPFRTTDLTVGKSVKAESTDNVNLDGYQALMLKFALILPPNRQAEVIVTPTSSPIPTRVYELVEKLPGYHDSIATVDIFNLTDDQKFDLEILSEIADYTHPDIVNATVHPWSGGNRPPGDERKARARISQVPRMKREAMRGIVKPETATLICKVRDKRTNTYLHQETHTVTLLPKDYMVWSFRDPQGEYIHRISHFIAAWIAPTDPDGLLDGVRSKAAKYHPDGILQGTSNNDADISLQMKALYDYLSCESGIKYVNQPFYFGIQGDGQRVLTAENVLRAGCGNCIDLTVLFASLMEGLGINPLIMLTRDHAFLAWGNRHRTNEMEFLECTMVGTETFASAQQSAAQTFRDNFLHIGSVDPLPNPLTYLSFGSEIVDLSVARTEGISSIR